jgi:hypothetical protein
LKNRRKFWGSWVVGVGRWHVCLAHVTVLNTFYLKTKFVCSSWVLIEVARKCTFIQVVRFMKLMVFLDMFNSECNVDDMLLCCKLWHHTIAMFIHCQFSIMLHHQIIFQGKHIFLGLYCKIAVEDNRHFGCHNRVSILWM